MAEINGTIVVQIKKTARAGYDDIDATPNPVDLGLFTDSTVNGEGAQWGGGDNLLGKGIDLLCQFPSGGKNKHSNVLCGTLQ